MLHDVNSQQPLIIGVIPTVYMGYSCLTPRTLDICHVKRPRGPGDFKDHAPTSSAPSASIGNLVCTLAEVCT